MGNNTFTQDANSPRVDGNANTVFGVYTAADGAAGSSVASSLEHIYHAQAAPKSCTTGGYTITINANVDGDVQILSATSGDTFYVKIDGR